MCGILFCIKPPSTTNFDERLSTLSNRGPDETKIACGDGFIAGHTRLCITKPMKGKQPIVDNEWVIVHNGEIYNGVHNKQSDSYHILEAIRTYGPNEAPCFLDGIFAYVAFNVSTKEFYAARDPVGVIPMYMAYDGDAIWFSSELKALNGLQAQVVFPGCIVTQVGMNKYANPYMEDGGKFTPCRTHLRELLTDSVQKRMHLDVPWGLLLSGGLDSSIIASIVAKASFRHVQWVNLHTFSIGLEDSPDLPWARKMASEIGSWHHEYTFTVEEGLDALRDTIYSVESYDVTTVRASVPMYLIGKHAKKCGVKVLFSGEGADELFAGYLYNKSCPGPTAMAAECITKMERLHYHDCARANKTLARHGIECRVPFLDKDVVHFAMNILSPEAKLSKTHPEGEKRTKWFLRDEFKGHMNEKLRTRTKEQFSDGVGNGWIKALKEHAEQTVHTFDQAAELYPYQTPQTKEAFLYRSIFRDLFGEEGEKTVFYTDQTTACSSESATTWSDTFVNDPSAVGL